MELDEVDYLIERYKAEIEAKLSIERHKAEMEAKLYSVRRAEYYFEQIQPTELQAGRDILQISPKLQADMIDKIGSRKDDAARSSLYTLEAKLLSRKLPLTLNVVERLLNRAATSNMFYGHWVAAVKQARQFVQAGGTLSPSLDTGLRGLQKAAKAPLHYAANKYDIGVHQSIVANINKLLGSEAYVEPDAGESWTDEALLDLEAMMPGRRSAWDMLFTHAATAEAAKPSARWLVEAERHKEAMGEEKLARHLASWLTLAAPPTGFGGTLPSGDGIVARIGLPEYEIYRDAVYAYTIALGEYRASISQKNLTLLKGLTWYASLCSAPELARAVGHLTQIAFTDVNGYGVWAAKAGNAGIWALGQMPNGLGVGPLARLRTKLRDRGALKLIAAAIETAAKNAGITVDELEDLAVPTGGLEPSGVRQEVFGAEGSAALTLDARTGQTKTEWFGADGKPRKTVPAGVKREFAAEVKALKAAEEEVKAALSAQAARFDGSLLTERAWPLAVWRERYAAHPVLGNLARRLIWTVNGVAGLPGGAEFSSSAGETIHGQPEDAEVRLWHPIGAEPDETLHWREALEARGIVQPFKQAHREVYLLTDAERSTRVYSNRFAAHILKQHQFNSLCILRGWKNSLRLMVDDSYPPATRVLPGHGLRAEFWVEGVGDDYQVDTNEAGTYLRLATDQVRFYRADAAVNYAHAGGGGYVSGSRTAAAEPVPLDQVPPLVLSEIMRDVDLFVGVASVGNDPAWADGGPEGRYRDYWNDYAFGELGETAKTRAEVLARLLPRLKIASRCGLDGKFLTVRGDLRTYKIHLGSGNILMEPNDQYLCIVPGRSDDGPSLFLPFEGDRMLAIILSKAFLLADDKAIKDPTIVSQIKRGQQREPMTG